MCTCIEFVCMFVCMYVCAGVALEIEASLALLLVLPLHTYTRTWTHRGDVHIHMCMSVCVWHQMLMGVCLCAHVCIYAYDMCVWR